MSEENAEWGLVCCCIPRFIVGLLLSCYFFFGALIQVLRRVFDLMLSRSASLTPIHCSGSVCTDVLTCEASGMATYHVRMAWGIVGGVIFGYCGIFGVMHRRPFKLHCFAYYLLSLAILLFILVLADHAYKNMCGAFSYNVIEEAVLWPTWWGLSPDLPVTAGVKQEIESMPFFPVNYVDNYTHLNVWKLYCFCMAWKMFLGVWLYMEMSTLAQYVAFGALGLGPTYSLMSWKENLDIKNMFREEARMLEDDLEDGIEAIDDELLVELLPEEDRKPAGGTGPGGYGSAPPRALPYESKLQKLTDQFKKLDFGKLAGTQ